MSNKKDKKDKNGKKEDKPETTALQLRTSPLNLDGLKGYDHKKKTDAIRAINKEKANHNYDNDLEYLNPHHLTMMKLSHNESFAENVDISIFTQLIRQDDEAKRYVSKEIFKKLDLSEGQRNMNYNSRIAVDDMGMITELNEKFFYEPYSDTLLVACMLFAIDEDEDMRLFRHKFKRSITEIKDYMTNLPLYFEDSVDGILEAIQTDEISGAKAHIYINFIYEVVVDHNVSLRNIIDKYSKEFKEALTKLSMSEVVRSDEVSMNQVVEATKYL